jgi:hypothetical protein
VPKNSADARRPYRTLPRQLRFSFLRGSKPSDYLDGAWQALLPHSNPLRTAKCACHASSIQRPILSAKSDTEPVRIATANSMLKYTRLSIATNLTARRNPAASVGRVSMPTRFPQRLRSDKPAEVGCGVHRSRRIPVRDHIENPPKILQTMAEARASRTHRRRGDPPPVGFEDHQACSKLVMKILYST